MAASSADTFRVCSRAWGWGGGKSLWKKAIIQHTEYVHMKLNDCLWSEYTGLSSRRWIGPWLFDLDANSNFSPVWLPPPGCRAPSAAAGTTGWRPESLSLGPIDRMAPFLSSSKEIEKVKCSKRTTHFLNQDFKLYRCILILAYGEEFIYIYTYKVNVVFLSHCW